MFIFFIFFVLSILYYFSFHIFFLLLCFLKKNQIFVFLYIYIYIYIYMFSFSQLILKSFIHSLTHSVFFSFLSKKSVWRSFFCDKWLDSFPYFWSSLEKPFLLLISLPPPRLQWTISQSVSGTTAKEYRHWKYHYLNMKQNVFAVAKSVSAWPAAYNNSIAH